MSAQASATSTAVRELQSNFEEYILELSVGPDEEEVERRFNEAMETGKLDLILPGFICLLFYRSQSRAFLGGPVRPFEDEETLLADARNGIKRAVMSFRYETPPRQKFLKLLAELLTHYQKPWCSTSWRVLAVDRVYQLDLGLDDVELKWLRDELLRSVN